MLIHMQVISRRQYQQSSSKRRALSKKARIALIVLGALAGLFVLLNLVMLVAYRGKVLPNYSVAAVAIGGIRYGELDQKVPVDTLLSDELVLQKDDMTKKITATDLGVTVDWEATRENIKRSRNWIPASSLLVKKSVPAVLTLDNATFSVASKSLEEAFTKEPLPERITFRDDNFVIAQPEDGFTLDVVELRAQLVSMLERGDKKLAVPVQVKKSDKPIGQLGGKLGEFQKHLDAKITYTADGQTKQLARADIAGFFEQDGQTLKLSETKIGQVVASAAQAMGADPVNQGEAVQASMYAVNKKQPVTFQFAGQGVKVHHYCVAAKGLSSSVLPEFRQKLAAVYGDPQGWAKGGKIAFVQKESGCDFTAWLSAASAVTDFSAVICDNYYSCRVGPNVIINNDRWNGATDPWNAAGGTIEDYRVMVINHETGHWLGFGHPKCPGAGQLAPVMQQQSIDLQGCKFNPRPTAAELAAL